MHCASCKEDTSLHKFRSHLGMTLQIDVCWPCQMIWFDSRESTQLAPASVIAIFRLIHEHRNDSPRSMSANPACPVCQKNLTLTHDIQRGGRFTYHRCQQGHGRLISCFQFLREKNFVRSLSAQEVATLQATVKQVRCSGCGAPVDLMRDPACTHCGAPISILDSAAVEKALAELDQAQQRQVAHQSIKHSEPSRTPAYLPQHWKRSEPDGQMAEVLVDLVLEGIGDVLSQWN